MIQNQINQEQGTAKIDKCKNLKKYSHGKAGQALLDSDSVQ